MTNPVLRSITTLAFSTVFYLIYFQAIGPALNWAPFGVQPIFGTGQWGLMIIVITGLGFTFATIVSLDARNGYVKKPQQVRV